MELWETGTFLFAMKNGEKRISIRVINKLFLRYDFHDLIPGFYLMCQIKWVIFVFFLLHYFQELPLAAAPKFY